MLGRFRADTAGEKVGMRTIVDYLNGLTSVTMRVGREQTTGKFPAHYHPRYDMVRTRTGESQINFHEAGHALSHILRDHTPKWWRGFQKQLTALTERDGAMASAKSPEEGMAEWVRLYITDPGALPPALSRTVEQAISRMIPEMTAGMRDAARMYAAHQWRRLEIGFRPPH